MDLRLLKMHGPFTSGECSVETEDKNDGAAVFSFDGTPFATFSPDCFLNGRREAIFAAQTVEELLNRELGAVRHG